MKVINSKEELEAHIGYSFWEDAYDVEANWIICEMEYTYPVLVECHGWDLKGEGWKVYQKSDIDELKKFINS